MNQDGFNEILTSIRVRPKEWKGTEHHLIHTESGIRIWIANGFPFTRVEYPVEAGFSLTQTLRFNRVLKKWKGMWIMNELQIKSRGVTHEA